MQQYIERYNELRELVDERLATVIDRGEPVSMYEPARYILNGGGKRIRPVLVMLACEAVGGDAMDALDAGTAIEILHNFTLVHDDIMDHADQRRGRETVHRKWDENVAILVGDELIGIAYKVLLQTKKGNIRNIASAFTEGMIEVCEGQSYDKEFEALPEVTEEQYLMMIAKKTGWLVTISAELGAEIGEASAQQKAALLTFARGIGKAFQIQDDLLDVIAEEKTFGKTIGGDILEGKKTWLLVRAMDLAEGEDLELLRSVALRSVPETGLVSKVTALYERLGLPAQARAVIRLETERSIQSLDLLPENRGKAMLEWFARMLLERKH